MGPAVVAGGHRGTALPRRRFRVQRCEPPGRSPGRAPWPASPPCRYLSPPPPSSSLSTARVKRHQPRSGAVAAPQPEGVKDSPACLPLFTGPPATRSPGTSAPRPSATVTIPPQLPAGRRVYPGGGGRVSARRAGGGGRRRPPPPPHGPAQQRAPSTAAVPPHPRWPARHTRAPRHGTAWSVPAPSWVAHPPTSLETRSSSSSVPSGGSHGATLPLGWRWRRGGGGHRLVIGAAPRESHAGKGGRGEGTAAAFRSPRHWAVTGQ